MKIQSIQIKPYQISLANNRMRSGVLIAITDVRGNKGWGEIAPLPKWSSETLEEALKQLKRKKERIINIEWTADTLFKELFLLELLPSVLFGFESALLSLLAPLPAYSVPTSALLMGSPDDILQQATERQREGFTSAKLKVSHLSFEQAERLIDQLKDTFRLRIDVNRAWSTSDSFQFFSQFPLDTFDYVEEPFQNPHELAQFQHPLAIDESFPQDLSLEQLALLPTLKALIYKPTIQGGMVGCLSLYDWATRRNVSLVLSSSFESDLGLASIASIAHRLSLTAPIGIGTYHYLNDYLCTTPLKFSGSTLIIPSGLMD